MHFKFATEHTEFSEVFLKFSVLSVAKMVTFLNQYFQFDLIVQRDIVLPGQRDARFTFS